MAEVLEFWFDYSCPYAYLASTRVEALARRHDTRLQYCPMLLGGVFRAIGTPQVLAQVWSEAKNRHNLQDMHRWAALWDVPLEMPASHPMRTVEALRLTLAAGCSPALIHRLFRAYWVEGKDLSDSGVLTCLAEELGLDGNALVLRAQEQAIKAQLRARTDRALELGIFGAPSMRTHQGVLYWGQDRLEFLERSLQGWVPASDTPGGQAASKPRKLEFYFDVSSPFAYLGSTQAAAVAARTGAILVWKPILLGGLFKLIGTAEVPLFTMPEPKRAMLLKDMDRWAEHWNVPFRFPSHFPVNTVQVQRIFLALEQSGRGDAHWRQAQAQSFAQRAFHAYWAEDRYIDDPGLLQSLLHAIGTDPNEVLDLASSPEIKTALRVATQAAADLGVFGVPTWRVNEQDLFWGQDRLQLVEDALLSSSDT